MPIIFKILRVAAEKCSYNGPLWNNIGMCFFSKGKYVAAISCLKKVSILLFSLFKFWFNTEKLSAILYSFFIVTICFLLGFNDF